MKGFYGLVCFLWFTTSVQAALTPAQYREHIGQLLLGNLSSISREDSCEIIGWAVDYSKLGTSEQEASRRFLREFYLDETGIDPSTAPANVKHDFTHLINDCRYLEGFAP